MEKTIKAAFDACARATGLLISMLVRRTVNLRLLNEAYTQLSDAKDALAKLIDVAEKEKARKEKDHAEEIFS